MRPRIVTLVTLALFALLSAVSARPVEESLAYPFTHAFIQTNVTCLKKPKQTRVKLVSQVFQYCSLEVTKGQIIKDNDLFRGQIAKAACESEYDITYESVVADLSDERIQDDHRAALRDPYYGKHEQWHASVDYPSSKCR